MKSARHEKIIELIQQHDIDTQEELAARLNSAGFKVTQATVSRDIRALKLTKVAGKDGKSRYAVLSSASVELGDKYTRVLHDALTSIDVGQNMIQVGRGEQVQVVRASLVHDLFRRLHLAFADRTVRIQGVQDQADDTHALIAIFGRQFAEVGHFVDARGAERSPNVDHRQLVVRENGLVNLDALQVGGGKAAHNAGRRLRIIRGRFIGRSVRVRDRRLRRGAGILHRGAGTKGQCEREHGAQ